MSTPAIVLQEVTHTYGKTTALDDLSLTVDQGSVFGLLGPNGAGKTTLFNILSTLLPVQSGSVKIFGMDAETREADIRERIGVVFQSAHVDPILTAEENLQFHGSLFGITGSSFQTRMNTLLERFKLLDRKDDAVSTFSGGMRRRLELAMGLLHKPDLLLLDEPGSGLDLSARKRLWADLAELQEQEEMTMMIATHDMEEAELCDTVAFLDDGTCVEQDKKENLKKQLGEEILYLEVQTPNDFLQNFQSKYDDPAKQVNGRILIQKPDAHSFIPELIEQFPGQIDSVTMRTPTLGDVYLNVTGTILSDQTF